MAGQHRAPRAPEDIQPDSDFETDDPRRPSGPNFLLQMMNDVVRAQGRLTATIENIQKSIDKQSDKLGKIDDLRVDLKEATTKLTILIEEQKEMKTRLDRVRIWVAGASAVLGLLIFVVPFAFRFWPASPPLPNAAPQASAAPAAAAPQPVPSRPAR